MKGSEAKLSEACFGDLQPEPDFTEFDQAGEDPSGQLGLGAL